MLQWSNRMINKPDMSHKVVKMLIVGVAEIDSPSPGMRASSSA